MRYYLDTEFDENGYGRINLISIGLRCEDGREYYAVAADGWDPKQVNPWVRENVLPNLRADGQKIEPWQLNNRILSHVDGGDPESIAELTTLGIPVRARDSIRKDLIAFLDPRRITNDNPPTSPDVFTRRDRVKPQIWGYFADYDWVLFCQLFGCMVDLPKFLPMYCLDLKQEMVLHAIEREWLPKQDSGEHNALADARWNERAHHYITMVKDRQRAERNLPW